MGDAFLTVSESPVPPPTLTWRMANGCTCRHAHTHTYDASIGSGEAKPRPASEPASTPEFYRSDRRRSTITYTCYVGVFTGEADEFDSFGREFDQYDIASSYASAQLPSSHVPRWSDESLPTPTRHGLIPTVVS
jgi:hypothetical protein